MPEVKEEAAEVDDLEWMGGLPDQADQAVKLLIVFMAETLLKPKKKVIPGVFVNTGGGGVTGDGGGGQAALLFPMALADAISRRAIADTCPIQPS